MPTYEYECTKCGEVFDIFQSIKARPLRRAHCETCGKVQPVRRLIGTGGAILFKGSGFYETDYRSESYRKAAKAEREKSGDSGKSAAAKESPSKSTSAKGTKAAADRSTSPSRSDTPKSGKSDK